jgi:mannose-6-phosphate isomerase-like protein (cupin superfamily)
VKHSGVSTLFASIAEIDRQRVEDGKLYREFLRVDSMSAGLYVLSVGATDLQRPHHEDEIYYVIRGHARFVADGRGGKEDREVSAGSVIFVAAEVEHRFSDVTEELAVLVCFAPAET